MIDLLFNPTGLLAGIGALLAALIGAWLHGRSKGREAEQAKHLRDRLAAREAADDIEDAIAGRSPEENRERLGQWSGKS